MPQYCNSDQIYFRISKKRLYSKKAFQQTNTIQNQMKIPEMKFDNYGLYQNCYPHSNKFNQKYGTDKLRPKRQYLFSIENVMQLRKNSQSLCKERKAGKYQKNSELLKRDLNWKLPPKQSGEVLRKNQFGLLKSIQGPSGCERQSQEKDKKSKAPKSIFSIYKPFQNYSTTENTHIFQESQATEIPVVINPKKGQRSINKKHTKMTISLASRYLSEKHEIKYRFKSKHRILSLQNSWVHRDKNKQEMQVSFGQNFMSKKPQKCAKRPYLKNLSLKYF